MSKRNPFKLNDPSTWKLSPQTAYKLRTATSQLRSAENILNILWKAQRGGYASMAAAGASLINMGIDVLSPNLSPAELVREMGYSPIKSDLGEFLCDKLVKSELPRTSMNTGNTRIIFWEAGVAAIYEGDSYCIGPFVREEVDLSEVISPLVWADGNDLMLSIEKGDGGRVYRTLQMPKPGVYIGKLGVDWLANRLEKREGSRSIILIGPSGVGKTTLARLVARKLGGGRALKVTSQVMRSCSANSLLDIIKYLKPKVLLLDDVQGLLRSDSQMNNYGSGPTESSHIDYEDFLSTMEALHGESSLIIGTLMDDNVQGGTNQHNGTDYFSGMRPGRVDEIIWIKRPQSRDRRRILLYYLKEKVDRKVMTEIVRKTRGLTGAYLKEVANRINIYGLDSWKTEVRAIKYAAPEIPKRASRSKSIMTKLQLSRREKRAAKRLRVEAQEESMDLALVKISHEKGINMDERIDFDREQWIKEKENYIDELLNEAESRESKAEKYLEEHAKEMDDIDKEIEILKRQKSTM